MKRLLSFALVILLSLVSTTTVKIVLAEEENTVFSDETIASGEETANLNETEATEESIDLSESIVMAEVSDNEDTNNEVQQEIVSTESEDDDLDNSEVLDDEPIEEQSLIQPTPDFHLEMSESNIVYSGTCGPNATYTIFKESSEYSIVISGTGEMFDYDEETCAPWCYYIENAESISATIEDGITRIGNYAFYGLCLSSVTIPNTLTEIGKSAFRDCYDLLSFDIPDSLTSIGDYAFSGCSLFSLYIPSSVECIGLSVFDWSIYTDAQEMKDGWNENMCEDGCLHFNISKEEFNRGIWDSGPCGANATFIIYHKEHSINIKGTGEMFDYDEETCAPWCYYIENAESFSVTIEDGITRIGNYAFANHTSLVSVAISDTVTSIGDHAFQGCESLTSISIPNSVISIGDSGFSECRSLASLDLGRSVKNIGSFAFYCCSSLTDIVIPSSITSINEGVFNGCESLSSVTIPDSVTSIGREAFSNCYSLSTAILGSSVKNIGIEAFWNSGLTKINIPNSVTSIGKEAFNCCGGLLYIFIPATVAYIGSNALGNIRDIYTDASEDLDGWSWPWHADTANVYYDVSRKDYENSAISISSGMCGENVSYTIYNDYSMTISGFGMMKNYDNYGPWYEEFAPLIRSVKIENGVTSVGDSAFMDCSSLVSVDLGDSVTRVGAYAFTRCGSLVSVDFGDSVTSVGDSAFMDCSSLVFVDLGDSVTSVGDSAFDCCSSLVSINLGNSLNRISYGMLSGCTSLSSITIPDSVSSIDEYAFENCESLSYVTIPDSVTSVGNYAFHDCKSLSSITMPISILVGKETFANTGTLIKLHLTLGNNASLDDDHEGNVPWSEFKDRISEVIVDKGITNISNSAFSGCESLSSVELPDSITIISENAFGYCSSLTTISLPDSLIEIGDSAFYSCESLASIVIPDSVVKLGNSTFYGCNSLDSVKLGKNLKRIENYAFSNCQALKSITIPNSVVSIGEGAFSDCKSLSSFVIPDSITSIDEGAFSGCESLLSVYVPSSVAYIGSYAFGSTRFFFTDASRPLDGWGEDANWCGSITQVFYNVDQKDYDLGIVAIRSGTCGENINYTIYNDCSMTISGSGTMDDYESYGSTPWYEDFTSLIRSVKIENGVTSIGSLAFMNCSSLVSVDLGDSVTSVGDSAFDCCSSLVSINLGNSLNRISYGMLSGCTSLSSITIPDSVTAIDTGAFSDCGALNSIIIPDSVLTLGYGALSGCVDLTMITMPISLPAIYDGFHDEETNTTVCLPNLKVIRFSSGNGKSIDYSTEEKDYPNPRIIEWEEDGEHYKEEYEDCYDYSLTPWYLSESEEINVIFDDDITHIGANILRNCKGVNSVTLPESLTSIGDNAFYGLTNTESLFLSSSVKEIGNYSFSGIQDIYTDAMGNQTGWDETWFDQETTSVHYGVSREEFDAQHGKAYSISFDGNGSSSGEMDAMENLEYNHSYTLSPNSFARKGYVFNGWNTEKDGSGGAFADGQDIKDLSLIYGFDIKFYAQWKPITYTIRYDSNNAEAEILDQEFEYDKKQNLLNHIFSETDRCLLNWNDKADGSGKMYALNEEVLNLSDIGDKVITLYAQWGYPTSEPYSDPSEGMVYKGTEVYLYCDTPNSKIYYTLDGSTPNRNSILYEGVIIIQEDTVIKALAVSDLPDSKTVTLSYSVIHEDEFGTIDPEDVNLYEELGKPSGFWLSDLTFNDDKKVYYDPLIKSYIPDDIRVYYGTKLLSSGTDYTVRYANNIKAGLHSDAKAPSITVTGKGNYVGTLTKTFDILPLELSEEDVTIILKQESFIHNGKAPKPVVSSVEYRGIRLRNNIDYTVTVLNPSACDIGTYDIELNFKGNYKGQVFAHYSIIDGQSLKPVSSLSVSSLKAMTYNGDPLTQTVLVKDGKTVLEEGIDYELEYSNNTDAGTGYAIITGNENQGYSGTLIRSFRINPLTVNAKNTTVLDLEESYDYDGSAISPDPVVEYNGNTLAKDTDYTLVYKNNAKAGKATITFTGKGNYKGSFSKTFVINKISLSDCVIEAKEEYPYEKGGVKPLPETDLVYNRDYTVSYKNNIKPGIATMIIKGKGNYEGTIEKSFNITSKDISEVNIQIPDKVYTGKANTWKSTPVLFDSNGKRLSVGVDYDKVISYTHNGKELEKNDILKTGDIVKVTIMGKGNYEGSIESSYRIVAADFSRASVTIPVQYYTGRPITLLKSQITVKLNKQPLGPNDFEIVSYENNTMKGMAKITLKGRGNYGGYKTVSFSIRQRSLGITLHFESCGATIGNMNDLVIYKDTKFPKCSYKKIIDGRTYTFMGWSTAMNGPAEYKTGDIYDYSLFNAGDIITLYAVWE